MLTIGGNSKFVVVRDTGNSVVIATLIFYLVKLHNVNFGDLAHSLYNTFSICTRILIGGHRVNHQIVKLKRLPVLWYEVADLAKSKGDSHVSL